MQLLRDIRIARGPLMGFVAMGVFWGVWSALIPQVKANVGADDAQLGRALLFVALGAIPAMIVGGKLGDRCGSWLLPVSIAVFGAASILPALAATPLSLSLWLLLVGAASGFMDVVMNGRVSLLEGRHQTPLMQLNHGFFAIVFFIVAALTGLLRADGVAVPDVLMGASFTILLLASLSHVRTDPTIGEEKKTANRRSLSLLVMIFGFIAFVAFLAENGMQSWSALHLERTLGADPAIGALGPGLLALAVAVGRFTAHGLGRRVGDGALLMGAVALGVAGAVVFGAASNVVAALAGLMLCGAGISIVAPVGFSLAGRAVAPDRRGRAIAAACIIAYAGFFVGPAVLGVVSDRFGLPAAIFTIGAIIATIVPSWLIACLVCRNSHPLAVKG